MATEKQKLVARKIMENHGNVSKSMREAGYSDKTAKNPKNLTDSQGWQDLMRKYLPDEDVMEVHQSLLNSKRIDHMVFPLGPKDDDDPNLSGSQPNKRNQLDELTKPVERTTLTDQEIKDMLATVNCLVRRIVHGETARHVYFWSPDANAQKAAVELAYKIKGRITNKLDVKLDDPRKDILNKYMKDKDASETKETKS